jgi:hypothetical protein
MGRGFSGVVVMLGLVAAAPTAALAQEDSPETLLEQRLAREAEIQPVQNTLGELTLAGPRGVAAGDLLFIGVDDTTVSTYNLEPTTGTPYPQFTGYQVWGAGLIPGAAAGDAVVYFNNGSTLYRWPANGSPELCCTLTYQAATASVVSATYDPVGGRMLFTKNISVEAVYALPVVAGSCPVSCEMTQEIVYPSTADIGGLAIDTATGNLYGTNDSGTSIVRINNDATLTVIAAYPAGQTDIDGLAWGDGRLYLITDQPGDIYIYNLGTASYETPIPNPWTTSEVFSGGAYGHGLIPVELQSLSVD